jgi:parvulin-like peptidyl-prolyl isomerase
MMPWLAEIQHILVMDNKIAKRILEEASGKNADFNLLVQQYSVAEDKYRYGKHIAKDKDLRSVLGTEVVEKLKTAKKGELLGPIETKNGFEIVLVHKIQPVATKTFEKVKGVIYRRLNEQKKEKQKAKLLKKLRDEATLIKSEQLKQLEKTMN